MAIKKTINGQTPKAMLKTTVTVPKKSEPIIEPEAEEETVSVVEILDNTPLKVIEELSKQPYSVIPEIGFEIDREENNLQKINQDKKFAKIALWVGIGFLVLMLLNKK